MGSFEVFAALPLVKVGVLVMRGAGAGVEAETMFRSLSQLQQQHNSIFKIVKK